MRRKLFLGSILILLLLPTVLRAQSETSTATASVYDIAFDSTVARLNKRQLAIYTGREYYAYFLKVGGKYGVTSASAAGSRPGEHPFFIAEEFRPELIEFEGIVYRSINLAFDICRSEVVVLNPDRKAIVLPAGKVQRFNYAGHAFRALNTVNGLEPDFYEILYWGDSTKLVSRRRKRQSELWHTISDYYVILNNQAYPVSVVSTKTKSVGVKSALLEIFKDQKEPVRTYIRQNKLKFTKKKKEGSLLKVVEYYASLKTK